MNLLEEAINRQTQLIEALREGMCFGLEGEVYRPEDDATGTQYPLGREFMPGDEEEIARVLTAAHVSGLITVEPLAIARLLADLCEKAGRPKVSGDGDPQKSKEWQGCLSVVQDFVATFLSLEEVNKGILFKDIIRVSRHDLGPEDRSSPLVRRIGFQANIVNKVAECGSLEENPLLAPIADRAREVVELGKKYSQRALAEARRLAGIGGAGGSDDDPEWSLEEDRAYLEGKLAVEGFYLGRLPGHHEELIKV